MKQSRQSPSLPIASLLAACTLLAACGGGNSSEEAAPAAQPSEALQIGIAASGADGAASAAIAGSAASDPGLADMTGESKIAGMAAESAASSPGTQASDAEVATKANAQAPSTLAAAGKSQTIVSSAQRITSAGATTSKVDNSAAAPQLNARIAAATTVSQASIPNSIWSDPETQKVTGIASGDGVSITASTVAQLTEPDQGAFYGHRVAIEDWAGVSRRYATEPAVTRWVKAETGRVDEWIVKKFERSDLIGGWTHDYVDPVTGLTPRWTVDSPEPPNGTTDKERKFKAAWVAYGRGYNIRQVLTAARIFKLTGNIKYGDWVASQLDFYASNYALWPLQTKEGRSKMYAQGLDEAVDSFALLEAARLIGGRYPTARIVKWRDSLFLPMAENLKFAIAPYNNVALWHQAAIAAIAMRYNRPSLLELAQNGPQGIRAILAACVTADNLWIEGSFSYNNYVVNVLSKLLVHASIEGYATRFAKESEQALQLLLAPLDYRFDNNTLPTPSDSSIGIEPIPATAHWQLFRVAPTYWGIAKANSSLTWEALVDPPAKVSSTAPTIPPAITRNFPSLRQAVLRAGSWQAYVHYGQSNGSHYQEEMTNFELHEGSTDIATDPGTVSYGSPYHLKYFRLGPAQNVPLVDGVGQIKWAQGNLATFSATESRLIVDQPKYHADASVRRAYRVTSSGFTEKSTFAVPSGTNRRLGVVFNTACSITMDGSVTPTTTISGLPDNTAFGYWKGVTKYSAEASWSATLSCGTKRYSYKVTGPSGQRIYVGKVPNTPLPAERNAIYYEVIGNSAQLDAEIRSLPALN